MMDRLVVVRRPDLCDDDESGSTLRAFAEVVAAVGAYCPWVHAVRLGVCSLPARGPARYFGGEEALADLVRAAASAPAGTGAAPAEVGIAEGLFAAELAARAGVIVPVGQTTAFLAPLPVAALGLADLDQLLGRLGIRTLGAFAALPDADVLGRFGGEGAAAHRVAGGRSGELDGQRDPRISRRLRGEVVEDGPPVVTPGFWGGTTEADARAARSLAAVQSLLGPTGVALPRLQGGRSPSERARLVTWTPDHRPRPVVATGPSEPARPSAPWPGHVPAPAPAAVHPDPRPVELTGAGGTPVQVSSRGLLDVEPERLSIDQGPWEPLTGWAGPWPADERWWSRSRRRGARLQAVTPGGAHLLVAERGRWWVEATYA
jgi:nucleotidyltransferase/DNA polymerase involved in DNA repair